MTIRSFLTHTGKHWSPSNQPKSTNAMIWLKTDNTETKNEISVIVQSYSCCSKPGGLSFLYNIILKSISTVICPYSEGPKSIWTNEFFFFFFSKIYVPRQSYRFGTTWVRANDDRNFIFGFSAWNDVVCFQSDHCFIRFGWWFRWVNDDLIMTVLFLGELFIIVSN